MYPDGTSQGLEVKYVGLKPSTGILSKKKKVVFQRRRGSLSSLPKEGKESAKVAERCETWDESGRPGFETRIPLCHPLFKKPLRMSAAGREKNPQNSGLDSPVVRAKD